MFLCLLSITLCNVLLLPFMMQPLTLSLVIKILTLLMCMISGMLLSSWYGYILFLIYVGGLLVMFAYVAALCPNILFGSTIPLIFGFFLFWFLLELTCFYIHSLMLHWLLTMVIMENLKCLKHLELKMVSPQMISILIGLGVILLINLVVVVKNCYYEAASLRPFN
uniref:NADH dehydrogenase subunit 6 n=1 Tax=Bivetiella cancellata TaxID=543397 RepID=C8XQN9_BIVCA|nr:NADH dehydrogenase subunit 6 [Bivetiella cancellata]ACF04820.1 NADH dehydrogenase subunit 6 [Bivetiella cancellata]